MKIKLRPSHKTTDKPCPAYTDVEFIQGLLTDKKLQRALYNHWKVYFNDHADAEFFQLEENRNHIIQNAFTVLWTKVNLGLIYVKDGVIIGNNGLPFSSSLTTYLMSVAKNNNKEIVRSSTKLKMIDDIAPRKQKDDNGTTDLSSRLPSEPIDDSMSDYKANQDAMAEIVADIVANLSERCSQILTLFYYKEKKLDDIMEELSSFNSKDALKTAKNKCLNKLKAVATQRYNDYLNA